MASLRRSMASAKALNREFPAGPNEFFFFGETEPTESSCSLFGSACRSLERSKFAMPAMRGFAGRVDNFSFAGVGFVCLSLLLSKLAIPATKGFELDEVGALFSFSELLLLSSGAVWRSLLRSKLAIPVMRDLDSSGAAFLSVPRRLSFSACASICSSFSRLNWEMLAKRALGGVVDFPSLAFSTPFLTSMADVSWGSRYASRSSFCSARYFFIAHTCSSSSSDMIFDIIISFSSSS
mmetsp:Transcript_2983/g.6886  ORF Transcript_2983/g.6886 Transcript_2983/m.6886 type:complete len:237 (-) Transcript_2983:849-1559(-)